MHEPATVGLCQAAQHRRSHVDGRPLAEHLALLSLRDESLFQCVAVQQLHRDEQRTRRGLPHIKDPDRVRMAELRRHLRLFVEPPHRPHVRAAAVPNHHDLDGDGLPRPCVLSRVDSTEPTAAQQAGDAIATVNDLVDFEFGCTGREITAGDRARAVLIAVLQSRFATAQRAKTGRDCSGHAGAPLAPADDATATARKRTQP